MKQHIINSTAIKAKHRKRKYAFFCRDHKIKVWKKLDFKSKKEIMHLGEFISSIDFLPRPGQVKAEK
jgi:hypothetical protein